MVELSECAIVGVGKVKSKRANQKGEFVYRNVDIVFIGETMGFGCDEKLFADVPVDGTTVKVRAVARSTKGGVFWDLIECVPAK